MPVNKPTAQTNRVSPAAAPRQPFHLRLPDVFAAERPRATRGPQPRPTRQPVANDPTARARAQLTSSQLTSPQLSQAQLTSSQLTNPQLPAAPLKSAPATARREPGAPSASAQLSQKRFQDGQQQVTGLIERMREKRRKLFDRLWVASIAITALSVVALAIELIQGIRSPAPVRVATRAVKRTESTRQVAKKPVTSSARPVSAAAARTSEGDRYDRRPVTSALYTTEDGPQPGGIWLDGPIDNSDSEPERLSQEGQHDGHQSRTR